MCVFLFILVFLYDYKFLHIQLDMHMKMVVYHNQELDKVDLMMEYDMLHCQLMNKCGFSGDPTKDKCDIGCHFFFFFCFCMRVSICK